MDEWRVWPCSARRDSPHTQAHAGKLSGLFGSFFSPLGLRTWWYKEPCVTISTPLLISCGPLSPDPLARVLSTSQDGKSNPTRGKEGDRKTGRERKRERGEGRGGKRRVEGGEERRETSALICSP